MIFLNMIRINIKIMILFFLSSIAAVASVNTDTPGVPVEGVRERLLRYDYGQALELSLLFLEAQRSGELPDDNRVTWRGNSCAECVKNGRDFSKGYYNKGHISDKGLFENAHIVKNLAWVLVRHEKAYESRGLLTRAHEALTWGAEYLFQSMNDGYIDILYELKASNRSWVRFEDQTNYTPSYLHELKLKAEDPDIRGPVFGTAAALAATSLALKTYNASLSERYLEKAEKLVDLGNSTMASYDLAPRDKLRYIAAVGWLSLTVKDEDKEKFRRLALQAGALSEASDGQKFLFVDLHYQVLLYDILGYTQPAHCYTIEADSDKIPIQKVGKCLQQGEAMIRRNMTTNNPFAAMAVRSVNRILGDAGRSFVTGFGHNPPQRPYHVDSSCPVPPSPCDESALLSPDPNPHTLPGGLVSGHVDPDTYQDERSEQFNAVDVVANTDLQTVLAVLVDLDRQNRLPDIAYECRVSFTVSVDQEQDIP